MNMMIQGEILLLLLNLLTRSISRWLCSVSDPKGQLQTFHIILSRFRGRDPFWFNLSSRDGRYDCTYCQTREIEYHLSLFCRTVSTKIYLVLLDSDEEDRLKCCTFLIITFEGSLHRYVYVGWYIYTRIFISLISVSTCG